MASPTDHPLGVSSKNGMSRRKLIRTSSAAIVGTMFFAGRSAGNPLAEVIETKVISWQPDLYHGWPTVAKRKGGELWVVWSGGREGHVCPFGQLCGMSSQDQGGSWGYPRVLLDGPLDDRDGGIVETSKGTLIATSFTSLAYVDILEKAQKGTAWDESRLSRWQAAHRRLGDGDRRAFLGHWLTRSTDGGKIWSERISVPVSSPHGPTVLRDGRLLYAGRELFTAEGKIGVCESKDDGLSWEWIAELPVRKGDDPKEYHELHMVQAADGSLVLQVRNHNKENLHETLQTESDDGGKTWTPLHSIGVWGFPSHLLLLKDGRLLMTYGHRRTPLGNQARISNDHGKTWSAPMVISSDATSGDLGYPSTVELNDGRLLTVWYELTGLNKTQGKAVLRQTIWRIA
jgi:sialidase-1